MLYKDFPLNNIKKVSFFVKKNQRFLLLQQSANVSPTFLKIPATVRVDWLGIKKTLRLGFFADLVQHSQFVSLLNSINAVSIFKSYKRKIVLKGTGYKINFNEDTKLLDLKLGFSHLCYIEVPANKIKIQVIKNILCLESFDKSFLGNFTSKIMNLKPKDSYKEKGFLFKNEKQLLKTIKKK